MARKIYRLSKVKIIIMKVHVQMEMNETVREPVSPTLYKALNEATNRELEILFQAVISLYIPPPSQFHLGQPHICPLRLVHDTQCPPIIRQLLWALEQLKIPDDAHKQHAKGNVRQSPAKTRPQPHAKGIRRTGIGVKLDAGALLHQPPLGLELRNVLLCPALDLAVPAIPLRCVAARRLVDVVGGHRVAGTLVELEDDGALGNGVAEELRVADGLARGEGYDGAEAEELLHGGLEVRDGRRLNLLDGGLAPLRHGLGIGRLQGVSQPGLDFGVRGKELDGPAGRGT